MMDAVSYPSEIGGDGSWDRPNIVLIIADDIGWGDLGCYGQKWIETPHLDQMARDGLRCTDCYVGSPVCAPSRSVLMTGRHAGHTRVRDNTATVGGTRVIDNGPVQHRVPLAPGDTTLASVLSAAGYATGGFGKWGLGEPATCGHPLRHGFDEWVGFLNQRRAHTYYPASIWDGTERMRLPGNQGEGRETHVQSVIMNRALDFIHDHQSAPFFCYIPTTLPHAPFEAPDEESLEPYIEEDWSETEHAYAAMVTRLDRDVGRLLTHLDELGIADETLVLFGSDHGPHETVRDHFNSNGPFRGGKRQVTEGGLRTPMVIRWPGRIEADRQCEAPWFYADLLPTLAEAAGIWPNPGHDAVAHADGISVLPTWLGTDQRLAERMLYWEFPRGPYQQAVRVGRWKTMRAGPDEPIECYDLDDDPGETMDVAEAQPAVVDRCARYMEQAHTPSKHWPR